MKVQKLQCPDANAGSLVPMIGKYVEIRKGRYVDGGLSHPLYSEGEKYFERIYGLEYRNHHVYFFRRFGNGDSKAGFHVGFTRLQHQQFMLLQNSHWIQKEENIRYLVNLVFLVIGAYIGLSNLK
ncbi:MAG: hypothetical protein ACK500_10555 [Flavobacteriales bacterium]